MLEIENGDGQIYGGLWGGEQKKQNLRFETNS